QWKHRAFKRDNQIAIRLKEVASYEKVVSYLDVGLQETVNDRGDHRCEILTPRRNAKFDVDGRTVSGDIQNWKASPFHFYNQGPTPEEQSLMRAVLGEPDVFFPGDDFNRNGLSKNDPKSSSQWSRKVDKKYDLCFSWRLLSRESDRFVMDV